MQTGRCTNIKIKKISVTYIESINYGYELFCHIFVINSQVSGFHSYKNNNYYCNTLPLTTSMVSLSYQYCACY